jgi:hypothetical protein
VRAPVGSRRAIWSAQKALRGSLVLAEGKGGDGKILIFLGPGPGLESWVREGFGRI